MPFTHRTKEESLEEIKNLVQTFSRNYKSYTSKDYDEANTRTDFIDKFFEALNWDVRNDGAKAERFREVVREDKVKIADQTKAPDYSFRIGGQKIFFVEAKKPSVNIKEDEAPAFQVRRYAYTAKLPLSILTDFEEFAVYDTKIKPAQKDNASTARIKYIRYDDYEKEFDFLWNTFSKQAVENGSFDNYAEETGGKKGTGEIDSALLDLIESWRLSLAKNIALRNETLSLRNLNAAVQKIIDRIIFLRIAEDKEMENYATLQNAAKQADIYGSLKKIFFDADKKYNSGIFKNESWINALLIDDKILKEIIDELYYPKCPYVWAALPVEILGNIYEKFLGSEITFKNIKGGHTASVEQKPEIKKAGGVFYTPRYIVEYIVSQTLGKKLEGLTTAQADAITVLDPACGSGSFLVGAYKYLLNWYLEQYTKSEPAAKNALKENKIVETTRGLSLSVEEKKRILTGHIFGVDIDSQAVEVTKLSLFLQMLEGEGKELHGTQSDLFRSSDLTILPDMGANIQCGNSLIASDFYADAQGSLFDDEAMIKVNAFDWNEAFRHSERSEESLAGEVSPSATMASPFPPTPSAGSNAARNARFDVIIGNPPYVRIQTINDTSPESVSYYNKKYSEVVSGSYDLYLLFIYKGMSLLKKDGLLGFIQPHKFFQAEMGFKLRKILKEKTAISRIVDFTTNQVFENATTYTCLLFLENSSKKDFEYCRFENGEDFKNLSDIQFEKIEYKNLNDENWTFRVGAADELINKLKNQKYKFSDITVRLFKGSSTGNDKIFLFDLVEEKEKTLVVKSELAENSVEIEKDILRKFLYGESVRRYEYPTEIKYLLFPYSKIDGKYSLIPAKEMKKNFPLAFSYLQSFKTTLMSRKLPLSNEDFYKYSAARSLNEYERPKILIPDMLVSNRISYDANGEFFTGPAIHCPVFNEIGKQISDKVYLAILNSSTFWFFISHTSTALRGNAYRLTPEYVDKFSFPEIDAASAEKLSALADAQIAAHKKIAAAVSEEDKRIARQRINALDAQINALVYKLYGLTQEEIAVVEKAR